MKRKGITPVIAVVLLLLITVAAVGLVWGLFQQVTGDQGALNSLNDRQKARNTEFTFRSVYNNTTTSGQGNITINVANTGSRAVNLSQEVSLYVVPPGSTGQIPFNVFASQYASQGWVASTSTETDCFDSNSGLLQTGKTYTCDTNIKFPKATQSIGLVINYKDVAGTQWKYTCSPQTSSTITC
ncbi:MAG: archaellin/type IV pilin N-terminal domain-containing protein [Candidatus Nanohaloarchaea archaeon]